MMDTSKLSSGERYRTITGQLVRMGGDKKRQPGVTIELWRNTLVRIPSSEEHLAALPGNLLYRNVTATYHLDEHDHALLVKLTPEKNTPC